MPVVLAQPDLQPANGDAIEIGLVNNMGDAGLESGQRQIVDLLSMVCGPRLVRLHLFTLPSILRGPAVAAQMSAYGDLTTLFDTYLDGLIVTGCEPRAERLRDEAFWDELTAVIDWAEHNTRSAIWSCLAAHAAVLHIDGIERRRLPEKCSGIYQVQKFAEHRLLGGMGKRFQVCHSRYNELPANELEDAGYEVLTRAPGFGVDTFVKQRRSLFLFLQGHPEYDADALKREYRRDVMRFLDGTSETYPHMPENYFGTELESALNAFAAQAKLQPDAKLASVFPLNGRKKCAGRLWNQDFAAGLFGNWLDALEPSLLPLAGEGGPTEPGRMREVAACA